VSRRNLAGPAAENSDARLAALFADARIDPDSASPRFLQVCLAIRERIQSKQLQHGERLPSEAEIGAWFGVSRITARRAVAELVGMGLAERQRGRPPTVNFQSTRQRGAIEDLLQNLLVLGERTTVKVIEFAYVPASPGVAAALEVPQGEPVQRVLRMRLDDGQPLSLIETFVPADLGRRYERADMEALSLQALFRRLGVQVARAEQSFTACLALGREARLLGVEAGAALFRITRTVYDQGGQPVEYVTSLYRSDRYEYQMSLVRAGGTWKRA